MSRRFSVSLLVENGVKPPPTRLQLWWARTRVRLACTVTGHWDHPYPGDTRYALKCQRCGRVTDGWAVGPNALD